MVIFNSDIKQTSPTIVTVDSAYILYLQGFDGRVSLKKDRPYVGLSVRINDNIFVIPLTSQTTQKRKMKGLKKTNIGFGLNDNKYYHNSVKSYRRYYSFSYSSRQI